MSMTLLVERLPTDIALDEERFEEVDQTEEFEPGIADEPGFESLEQDDDDFDDVDDEAFPEERFTPIEHSLSLEKAWHGLHFLLTGNSEGGSGPEAFLLNGGSREGEDAGYGPARVFESSEVQDIANALEAIDGDELWGRFDAQKMTAEEVYPNIWDEEEDELQEEFVEYYEELREFISEAAESGEALRLSLL